VNTIIENITKKQESQKKFCKVIKPLSGTSYQVRDSAGRILTVDSDIKRAAGDSVTVVSGFIVGRTNRQVESKVFNV
jgi:hypothetical protein